MKANQKEITVLRELAERYMAASASQDHVQTKQLWRDLHDRKMKRPMVYVWAVIFTDELAEIARPVCRNPLFLSIEKRLKIDLYHFDAGDDYLLEPFIELPASFSGMENGPWGVRCRTIVSKGGADKVSADPPVKNLSDLSMIQAAGHSIDEDKTAADLKLLQEAIGDIIPVRVNRQPSYGPGFPVELFNLRGYQQVMIDMVDDPGGLHRLLDRMCSETAAAMDKAEKLGDFQTLNAHVQSCPYSSYTPDPSPVRPANRRDLWCHAHAQQFTLISPKMHEEFALRYQKPIMEQYAASAYGCCEDLTRKIDMLRPVKNLKMISVAPATNLEECAVQIGRDYVISWRPNPTDHVCAAFDRERIRRNINEGCEILDRYGCQYEINLKDVVSLCGERGRIREWVSLVRGITG